MRKEENNYAFIDAQNLHMGAFASGIDLDYQRFRIYLKEKFGVHKAYLFIGYIPKYERLYVYLRKCGYVLDFKKVLISTRDREQKGNVDAHLAFSVMRDLEYFSKAIIVTSDGDFDTLVEFLNTKNKLLKVISPDQQYCSLLLKKAAQGKMLYLTQIRNKISK
jgi:uncharacterized LabA/DUF88 family protein